MCQKEILLIFIFVSIVLGADYCDKTQYPNQSPITLHVEDHSCAYLKMFKPAFADELIDFKATFKSDRYTFTNFPDSFKLFATDSNKTQLQYTLQAVYVKSPAEHQIINVFDPFDKGEQEYQIELQFFFQITEDDLKFNQPVDEYRTAGVSVIFTNRSMDGKKIDYLPDGTHIIAPFFPYRQNAFSDDDNVQLLEANFYQIFKPLQDYYHYWFSYKGRTTIASCKYPTNWYVNEQKFHISNELIDRYRKVWAGVVTEDSPYYQKKILDANNRPIQYHFTNETNYPTVMKICYSGFVDTKMRENYALWLWCVVLFFWWIIEISTENDTDSCFMNEMKQNKWTQIPFYSVYSVNSDIFFTKLTRYTVWLVQFGWSILILSIQFGQFYREDKYGVSDVTILWCAIISMVTSWPFGYFFGSIMYHTRELVKSGFYWKLEYKKITDKTLQEAVEIKKQIEETDERVYTYYFIFYFLAFFLLMAEVIISIWQNIYMINDEQDYWVASIFVYLFMDLCIFDIILAVIPNSWNLTKYRGFYYDFELGQAYKKMEEY